MNPAAVPTLPKRSTLENADLKPRLIHDPSGKMNAPTSFRSVKIVLLTPYSGNNLGDAAIQDTMIANLRRRLPHTEFAGVTLNSGNFIARHGSSAFPLTVTNRPFYSMSCDQPKEQGDSPAPHNGGALRSVLGSSPGVKKLAFWTRTVLRELRHCFAAYRFLRGQNVLIVSGGGQLDEEWGGAWGHPYALFKWAAVARLARVPVAFASVGACKVNRAVSRWLLRRALRLAQYRSYRDAGSKNIAVDLIPIGSEDPVVADVALSVDARGIAAIGTLTTLAAGRRIVAISPIAFARSGSWPHADETVYTRYLREMSRLLVSLLDEDWFPVIVRSAVSDAAAIEDLMRAFNAMAPEGYAARIHVPAITTWQDLVSVLHEADLLVASRLHSAIFGFVASKPTIAISFDLKVDWLMRDFEQTRLLFQIREFTAGALMDSIRRLEPELQSVGNSIQSQRERLASSSAAQYDRLASLACRERRDA